MAPISRARRARRAEAGPEDPTPKETIESKLPINTPEDEGHRSASLSATRSEDTETAVQDTANAAANVSAAPLDSIEPVDPLESAEVPSSAVLPKWNGRRPRIGQRTEEKDELEVADLLVTEDFRSNWASRSASEDVVDAAAAIIKMQQDANYDPPVQEGGGP